MSATQYSLICARRLLIVLGVIVAIHLACGITPSFAADEKESNEVKVSGVVPAGQSPEQLALMRSTIEVSGEGPDVVFIPGLSTSREVWRESVAALEGKYRVHLVQIRGFGDEAGPNAEGPVLDPVMEELAAYIDREIVGMGRPAPAIVGHSLGGLGALMISAKHPANVSRVMVVDAVPFIGTIFGADRVESIEPRAASMKQMIAAGYRPDAETPAKPDCNSAEDRQQPPGNLSNSARGLCLVNYWTSLSDQRVVAQAMYDDMITDMRPELPNIAVPVRLLYAQDERSMTPQMAKAAFEPQYEGTPDFSAQMVPGSFHFIMLDQPGAFVDELEAFLAPIDASEMDDADS